MNDNSSLGRLRTREFPWTAETIYMDSASTGPIPERTRKRLEDFAAKRTAPYLLPDEYRMQILADARTEVARLIGADTSEIALATNTSHGINLAASALPLKNNDVILISDREFPANVYPWMLAERRGVKVELVPNTENGWPNEARLLERVTDPRVRVLAISLVQFHNGYLADLKTLGDACRENGVFLVVDAIQGLGHVPFDVKKTPVDILASGGQKWLLSPWGSGFVYVKKELLNVLEPVVTGWMAFEGTEDFTRMTEYDATFLADGRRYEFVTLPFQDILGMLESVSFLNQVGVENVRDHTKAIKAPLKKIAEDSVIEIVSPVDCANESSIVCFTDRRAREMYDALTKAHVICSFREGAIRLSPHLFNTESEMDKVAEIVRGV